MKSLLIDTSIWVDYFNQKQSLNKNSQLLDQILDDQYYKIYLCPIIYQEILQGINDEKVFLDIKNILGNLRMLHSEILFITNLAIDLYRSIRKKGITIQKSNDCLIAAYAIHERLSIFHKDRDFELISKYSRLEIFNHDKPFL